MKSFPILLLFTTLAGSTFAQDAAAPRSSPASILTFSLTPHMTLPVSPDGSLGGGIMARQGFAPGWGATFSCQYRLSDRPLFVGADLGYSWVPFGDWPVAGIDPFKAWPRYPDSPAIVPISMVQAGATVGIQLDVLPPFSILATGSAGYSCNFLGHGGGWGATPFVSAGAEISLALLPPVSLAAGAKYRYFVDFCSDLAITCGISYKLRIEPDQGAIPPRGSRKSSPHPRPLPGPDGDILQELARLLTPAEPAVVSLSIPVIASDGESARTAADRNLRVAEGLYEALRKLDITCVWLPESMKLPVQLLRDRSGTCWDLAILFCSLLESAQVEAAFITVPGRVLPAFALAGSEEGVRQTPLPPEELLFRHGRMWVPIEVTDRGAPFFAACQAGADLWRAAGKQARLYPIADFAASPVSEEAEP